MKYVAGADWKLPVTIKSNGKPKNLTNCEVTLIIDGKDDTTDIDRLEEVSSDHMDPENGLTLFVIPRNETEQMEAGTYELYYKVHDLNNDTVSYTERYPFTIIQG